MTFSPEDLTDDGFLGGQIRLWQPRQGYRAATDPVFLAAACPVVSGQSVLELGCGAGAALICLMTRVSGVQATGLEVQSAYAQLARQNLDRNTLSAQIFEGDLKSPPAALRALSFDHVIANPPYFSAHEGDASDDPGRDLAYRDSAASQADWIDAAIRRLRPGGYLTLIQRVERMTDLLLPLEGRMGDIRIRPLAARSGRAAKRILIRARKGSGAPLQLLPAFVLHDGAVHERDQADFSEKARAVLRDGAALYWCEA